MEPDCYKCKHRRDLCGDAHSCCKHPLLEDVNADPLAQVFAILGSVGRTLPTQKGVDKLGIKANYHGIKRGWFNFPFNYDPVWLEECKGFEVKELQPK